MSLPLPNLDDRNFADLVSEMRALIPRYAPQWTDHNISDPGITLIELLAYLSEMILYRQNIVTEKNFTNFLKLALDPPMPVIVDITLTLNRYLDTDFHIKKGSQFSNETDNSLIFETFQSNIIPEGKNNISLQARNCTEVKDEVIGISDGSPNQLFSFTHSPVLIDRQNTGLGVDDYNPNPKIFIDGVEWFFVRDFLEEPPKNPLDHTITYKNCYTVEDVTYLLKFSDGSVFQIPPAGADIVCTQYQIVLGDEVKISKDCGLEYSGDIPAGTSIVSITNEEAEGGINIFPIEKAKILGLQKLKERYRAISENDFVFLTTELFNELQISQLPEDQIARARVVPNRNLNLWTTEEQEGEISIIIVPFPKIDPGTGEKEKTPIPSSTLIYKVWKFLENRRLLGTRHHVVRPRYIPITINIEVYRKTDTNISVLQTNIGKKIKTFLHPLEGSFDGKGWPFGRNLYPSELYQLVEGVEGVDYVKQLSLNGQPGDVPIELNENELPDPEAAEVVVTIDVVP